LVAIEFAGVGKSAIAVPLDMLFTIVLFAMLILSSLAYGWAVINRPTHAGGIVYKKDEGRTLYLIVSSLSIKNKWVLPKGHIEKNEKAIDAAVREVLEEGGVLAKPVKKAGIVHYRKKGRRLRCVYFIMECLQAEGIGLDNRKVLWVEKQQALEMLGRRKIGVVLDAVNLG
jgi:8-oxo-dGTP pyrophosphatase MutT (NUDIX family)